MPAPVLTMLRRRAVGHTLFPPTGLQAAIDRMQFVQADPIRSPARAQDLILRQRVEHYQAGDLERTYPALEVEEDYVYAYGFTSRAVWNLLHPRRRGRLTMLERKVLDVVRAGDAVHPAQLEAELGRRRVVNAWGGYSKATTRALETLHHRGLIRVSRRENGIRVYSAARAQPAGISPTERLRSLVMVLVRIFAPSPESSLRAIVARYRHLGDPGRIVSWLLEHGSLRRDVVDGIAYLSPVASVEPAGGTPRVVRFLAPFDPLVWDRARFEHFWGWAYRFEAYTPVARRVRGYYAMPLLWNDDMVGWASARSRRRADGTGADVEIGYVVARPKERDFSRELEAEVARLESFLAT